MTVTQWSIGLVCVKYHPTGESGIPSRIKDISLEQFGLLPLALVPSVSRKETFFLHCLQEFSGK